MYAMVFDHPKIEGTFCIALKGGSAGDLSFLYSEQNGWQVYHDVNGVFSKFKVVQLRKF